MKLVILLRDAEMDTLTKLQITSLIIAIFIKNALPEETCHQMTIDGVNYVKETLKSDIDKPYNLAIDKTKNTVYFSYGEDVTIDAFKAAFINLDTKEFDTIPGIKNGFTVTVDGKNHNVYVGGSDGIYKFKHGDKTAELIAEKGTNIWYIYFNEILYYSLFPTQFFYTLNDGEINRFKDLEATKVDQFIIDDDVIYYTDADGLYKKGKNDVNATIIEEFKDDPRCLIHDGGIYLCLQDGVYTVDKETNTIDKYVNLTDVYGLAIDKDENIIYSDASNVYRLNKDKTC